MSTPHKWYMIGAALDWRGANYELATKLNVTELQWRSFDASDSRLKTGNPHQYNNHQYRTDRTLFPAVLVTTLTKFLHTFQCSLCVQLQLRGEMDSSNVGRVSQSVRWFSQLLKAFSSSSSSSSISPAPNEDTWAGRIVTAWGMRSRRTAACSLGHATLGVRKGE